MECHEKMINIVIVTNSGDRFSHAMKAKAFEMLINSWGMCRGDKITTPVFKIDHTYINLNNVESITQEC